MKSFMEMIEEELGTKADERPFRMTSSDILKLNNEISADSEGNERLLNNSPAMADRFPCSK